MARLLKILRRDTGRDILEALKQLPPASQGRREARFPDLESNVLWSHLPADTQAFLWSEVDRDRAHRARREANQTTLDAFLYELFHNPRHTELLLQLCKDLRYVHEHARDLMDIEPESFQAYECNRTDDSHSLDLLGRASADGTCTKFVFMHRLHAQTWT